MLGQLVSLWQQIEDARQAVRTAPKTLADTEAQLYSLVKSMREVEREPELQTPIIYELVEHIAGIATELKMLLDSMMILKKRSALRQGLYALRRRTRDQSNLDNVLGRLERAKGDLLVQINVRHLDLTRRVGQSVERIGRGVYAVIENDGRSEPRNHLILERNESMSGADQVNGILGVEESRLSTTAKVVGNKAHGSSRQRNIILGGTHSLKNLHFSDD